MGDAPDLHKNPDRAAEMAVNCIHSYLTQCGIVDGADRRAWINRVCHAALAREERTN